MSEKVSLEQTTLPHTEVVAAVGQSDHLPPDVAALFEEYEGAKHNKLMRKMDYHLIPIVSFLFN